jgi:Transmembrane domain of unknown function (DUF3566)
MATKRAVLAPPATTGTPAAPAKVSRREKKRQAAIVAGAQRGSIERRYHQTVRRIDVWSVLKVSVCFYLCALVVFLAAGIVLWTIADSAGTITSVENFISDLLDERKGEFHFLSFEILRAATLIGLVIVCFLTVLTVLAAAFYNLFADLVGGVEITVVEES